MYQIALIPAEHLQSQNRAVIRCHLAQGIQSIRRPFPGILPVALVKYPVPEVTKTFLQPSSPAARILFSKNFLLRLRVSHCPRPDLPDIRTVPG